MSAASASRRRALRTRIANEQGWRCCYCGVPMVEEPELPNSVTLERVIPGAQGGRYEYGNLAAACYNCNNSRGSKDPGSFTARLSNRYPMKPDEAAELRTMISRSGKAAVRLHRPWPEAARATLADVWPQSGCTDD